MLRRYLGKMAKASVCLRMIRLLLWGLTVRYARRQAMIVELLLRVELRPRRVIVEGRIRSFAPATGRQCRRRRLSV